MSATGQMTIWMRLRGYQQTIAGLKASAVQTGVLGTATQRLSGHMQRAARRTWLMNQALFTLRRYAYMSTLALTAGMVVVAKWGFDYLSQVQEARLAFHKFGLTQEQVNDEVRTLYRLAAISPFLFTDITRAARRFMAFGMDVETANATVTHLSDALVTYGVATGAAMNRASLAISHMMSLGRVTGQIIYQLARDNVPIIQALEKELGLTGDQLRNVGRLGIPASVAIQALNKYIAETPRFQNASLIFATRTWRGIVTTTRDYMAQFMGSVEEPLFKKLQKGARRFMMWLSSPEINKMAAKGDILGVVSSFSPALAGVLGLIFMNLRSIWNVLIHGVIPQFITLIRIVGPPLYVILWAISHAFKVLGDNTWLLYPLMAILTAQLAVMTARWLILLPLQMAALGYEIAKLAVQKMGVALGILQVVWINAETGAITANNAANSIRIFRLTALGRTIVGTTLFTKLATWATRLWTAATVGSIRATNGQFVALTRLEILVMKARRAILGVAMATRVWAYSMYLATRSMIIFLFTNPIGWAILLAAALTVLYFRWKAFREEVNKLFWAFIHNKGLVGNAINFMLAPIIPFVGALRTAYRLILRIKRLVESPAKEGGSWLKGLGSWAASSLIPGGGFIPGLAGGGLVTRSGAFMVGEHGPELAYLRRGEAVKPISQAASLGGLGLDKIIFELYNRTVLEVDGQKMAEAVSKHRLDAGARR